ncbi:MAG: 8-amino-7-oxononanoate synthase, partial [bacterium]
MDTEAWIADELESFRRADLARRLTVYPRTGGMMDIGGRIVMNLASNDYLDLAHDPAVAAAAAAAIHKLGAGATASRLVAGTLSLHEELEKRLAACKGYQAALVFGSGYMANSGAITSIVGRGDTVFADRLAHASIIDAVILSRARLQRYRHNDPSHLEELLRKSGTAGRRLVVTESVFSMDGDIAPLLDIANAAAGASAMLMVDEAHSTGVFGPGGAGLIRELRMEDKVNISMGTLSKALGGYGGFVACSAQLCDLMVNKARPFIFSTGLPPASAASALAALDVLAARPDIGKKLLDNAALLRRRLQDAGLDTGGSASQIIPVMVGENRPAIELSGKLM